MEDSFNLKKFIDIAQSLLNCPVCGEPFAKNNLKLRGFLDDRLVMESYCNRNHLPATVIFITQIDRANNRLSQIKSLKPITTQDVVKIRQQLKDFDGNFSQTFTQHEN